jgi:hypothetical protein
MQATKQKSHGSAVPQQMHASVCLVLLFLVNRDCRRKVESSIKITGCAHARAWTEVTGRVRKVMLGSIGTLTLSSDRSHRRASHPSPNIRERTERRLSHRSLIPLRYIGTRPLILCGTPKSGARRSVFKHISEFCSTNCGQLS